MSNESSQKLLAAETSHHDKIEALRRENKQKEDSWNAQLEQLRKDKDAKIRQIEREKEEQRNTYETKINILEI